MKAFVTGGGGFIGRALVRQLRERGDEVRALVRSTAQAALLEQLGCELREGDLASVERL
ncbi:MAG: NAD(P)H-binding protein, partial [Chloroflexota bacterium]